jgi:hypothetical protein
VRGMAVWCLTQMGRMATLAQRAELLSDDGPVRIYEDGQLVDKRVGELAVK